MAPTTGWLRKAAVCGRMFAAVDSVQASSSRQTRKAKQMKVKEGAKAAALAAAVVVMGGCCPDQICCPGPVDAADPAPKKVTRTICLLEDGNIGKYWYT